MLSAIPTHALIAQSGQSVRLKPGRFVGSIPTGGTALKRHRKGSRLLTRRKKKYIAGALAGAGAVAALSTLTGCASDADVVSENLSKAAENFEVNRRIVMFNGITDKYLLEIDGPCSIEDDGNQLEVTCKTGPGEYKKHFLGLSDNVSYFVEQGEPVKASANHYRVIFKPQSILPDVDFRGSTSDVPRNQP